MAAVVLDWSVLERALTYVRQNIFEEAWMYTTVSKWGNSLGIRIPRGIAQDANVTEGTAVDLRVEDGRIVAEPIELESLNVLLARITPENRHGEQLQDDPIGREAW